jgi:hypothetical protein
VAVVEQLMALLEMLFLLEEQVEEVVVVTVNLQQVQVELELQTLVLVVALEQIMMMEALAEKEL